jgi:hypothetical protein
MFDLNKTKEVKHLIMRLIQCQELLNSSKIIKNDLIILMISKENLHEFLDISVEEENLMI